MGKMGYLKDYLANAYWQLQVFEGFLMRAKKLLLVHRSAYSIRLI